MILRPVFEMKYTSFYSNTSKKLRTHVNFNFFFVFLYQIVYLLWTHIPYACKGVLHTHFSVYSIIRFSSSVDTYSHVNFISYKTVEDFAFTYSDASQ